MSVINTHSFGRFWPVSWTITQFWGPGVISTTDEPRGAFTCRLSTLTFLANSGSFHAVLLTVWGPRAISTIDDPSGAFMSRSSTLAVLADSPRFMDYYSLFWSPGVMYTSNEPCGAFTCQSSTLAVLADSDPFRGLLLTVLGPQSDFHSC